MASSHIKKPGELCFFDDNTTRNTMFLTNFYSSPIKYKNEYYRTAEHLFQVSKCLHHLDKERIKWASTPKTAKIMGQFVEKNPNFEKEKVNIMQFILRIKFQKQSMLNRKLCETEDKELIYLNYWHDTFWGTCICTRHKRNGKNMLGKLLMRIRAEGL